MRIALRKDFYWAIIILCTVFILFQLLGLFAAIALYDVSDDNWISLSYKAYTFLISLYIILFFFKLNIENGYLQQALRTVFILYLIGIGMITYANHSHRYSYPYQSFEFSLETIPVIAFLTIPGVILFLISEKRMLKSP